MMWWTFDCFMASNFSVFKWHSIQTECEPLSSEIGRSVLCVCLCLIDRQTDRVIIVNSSWKLNAVRNSKSFFSVKMNCIESNHWDCTVLIKSALVCLLFFSPHISCQFAIMQKHHVHFYSPTSLTENGTTYAHNICIFGILNAVWYPTVQRIEFLFFSLLAL